MCWTGRGRRWRTDRRNKKGLRDRISPTCTLSQNGYGSNIHWVARGLAAMGGKSHEKFRARWQTFSPPPQEEVPPSNTAAWVPEASSDVCAPPAIAQLVEHLTVECCSNQMVPGSIPGGRTLRFSGVRVASGQACPRVHMCARVVCTSTAHTSKLPAARDPEPETEPPACSGAAVYIYIYIYIS